VFRFSGVLNEPAGQYYGMQNNLMSVVGSSVSRESSGENIYVPIYL
jgi:hypothetical protein